MTSLTGSSSYKALGMFYEKHVQNTLRNLWNIQADLTAASGDRGIDLIGRWMLKGVDGNDFSIPVLVQCKRASSISPNLIRELEGAWQRRSIFHEKPLAIMAATCTDLTRLTREALKVAIAPMLYLSISEDFCGHPLFVIPSISFSSAFPNLIITEERIMVDGRIIKRPHLLYDGLSIQNCK